MAKRCIIYGLVDPSDGHLRYIGQTVNGLNRPRTHLQPSMLKVDTHKSRWIRKVLATGSRPEIVIIQDFGEDPTCLNDAEIFWMDYFRKMGFDLTNTIEGGVARPSSALESREKIKQRLKAACSTAAGRERMRQAGLKHRNPEIRERDRLRAIKQFESAEVRAKCRAKTLEQFASVEARNIHAKLMGSRPFVCLETGVKYVNLNECGRELGLFPANIRKVLIGERRKTGGLTFKYLEA